MGAEATEEVLGKQQDSELGLAREQGIRLELPLTTLSISCTAFSSRLVYYGSRRTRANIRCKPVHA